MDLSLLADRLILARWQRDEEALLRARQEVSTLDAEDRAALAHFAQTMAEQWRKARHRAGLVAIWEWVASEAK